MWHTFYARGALIFRLVCGRIPYTMMAIKRHEIGPGLQLRVLRRVAQNLEAALHRLRLQIACTKKCFHLIAVGDLSVWASWCETESTKPVLYRCDLYGPQRATGPELCFLW